ncbi:MAG: caspase family protein [Rhodoblastus sp.]|nr:MAG: caspase family protein [Rhodoblastus sp.]
MIGAVPIRRAGARFVAAAFGALCLWLGAAGVAPAQAKTLGLLFGVSAYPNFPADKRLRAPANDVRRVMRALSARGLPTSDFIVLADGVEGTRGAPTRAAILGELDRLAASAERGDLVVVYGSGHGSRQAARAARKSDGLDQLFLPADAAPNASAGAEPFSAAIVSTEFGARLDAIRLKGADVWFILDSCFSGAASRDVEGAARDKKIDPPQGEASVANALSPDRTTPLAEQPAPPPGAGRLVAFYASQPNETAREAALPANLPLAKRSWGSIFTLALAQALERSRGLSYRQTLVEAGRLLRADPSFQARQTPSFEGDGLDAPFPAARRRRAGRPGASPTASSSPANSKGSTKAR